MSRLVCCGKLYSLYLAFCTTSSKQLIERAMSRIALALSTLDNIGSHREAYDDKSGAPLLSSRDNEDAREQV
jgi:hypothetical protein